MKFEILKKGNGNICEPGFTRTGEFVEVNKAVYPNYGFATSYCYPHHNQGTIKLDDGRMAIGPVEELTNIVCLNHR